LKHAANDVDLLLMAEDRSFVYLQTDVFCVILSAPVASAVLSLCSLG